MNRYRLMLSDNGYEMGTAIANDPDFVKSSVVKITSERAQISYLFQHGNTAQGYQLDQHQKELQRKAMDAAMAQDSSEADVGQMMAYELRKRYAGVQGKEFIFAFNKDDMEWIYMRDPISAGLIICELFVGTESNEFVNKEIEDPRTGKMRRIVAYNKNSEEEWDDLQYELEDFQDIYKAHMRKKKRREERGK
jgi:hypothetical protein